MEKEEVEKNTVNDSELKDKNIKNIYLPREFFLLGILKIFQNRKL
jgi:hypothetical protein